MAKKTTPTYRVRLYDARGRIATPGRAASFSITYGKRKIVTKEPFPKKFKAKDKKSLVQAVVEKVERRRLKVQEESRKNRARAKREAASQKKKEELARLKRNEQARIKRQLKKDQQHVKEVGKELKVQTSKLKDILKGERLLLSKTRHEVSKTRFTMVRGLVAITPVKSASKEYTKEIIKKTIVSKGYDGKLIDIEILNFTLRKPVAVNRETAGAASFECYKAFRPHITKFFHETKGTERAFIFRVKYDLPLLGDNGMIKNQNRGVSVNRILINGGPENKGLERLLENVLKGFATFKTLVVERYLGMAVTNDLHIMGFTLENVIKMSKRRI